MTWIEWTTVSLLISVLGVTWFTHSQRHQFAAFVVTLSFFLTYAIGNESQVWDNVILFSILNVATLVCFVVFNITSTHNRAQVRWTYAAIATESAMLPSHPLFVMGALSPRDYVAWVNICYWSTIIVIILASLWIVFRHNGQPLES